ncbi:DgyrCDS9574 [Dimorphilus gyrociliatus]|uniref:Carboxylic ester hydrolase n=1 Tax=Dimorphilus gyrociliatus TaxID=2664684 RepID=A0A7I8W037_9ANNE|nr:DgyrCDS9574 [Dimorphilus gyrociliatus]
MKESILLLALLSLIQYSVGVSVLTNYGKVKGKRIKNALPRLKDAKIVTKTVDIFYDIPYAKSPIAKLRFKNPEEPNVENIDGRRREFSECPQISRIDGNEDCLKLDIYSPFERSKNTTYPVMVYIHGGSYKAGSKNMYDGTGLSQYGVVVVTINYRLGIFGFLTDGTDRLRGNYGLADQIQALKWINRNIRAFRGNPNRITLFGNSAGGSSVGFLSLSPIAKGLFNNAVLQSGSPTAHWAYHNTTANLKRQANLAFKKSACDRSTFQASITCLRNISVKSLIKLQLKFIQDRSTDGGTFSLNGDDFRPNVDGRIITDDPLNMIKKKRCGNEFYVVGVTKDEFSDMVGMNYALDNVITDTSTSMFGMGRSRFEIYVSHVFGSGFGWDNSIVDIIKYAYTDYSLRKDPTNNRKQYIKIMTDMMLVAPAVRYADLLQRRKCRVYLYNFEFAYDERGSYHQIELEYLFSRPFRKKKRSLDQDGERYYNESDFNVSRLVMDIWTSIAKSRLSIYLYKSIYTVY